MAATGWMAPVTLEAWVTAMSRVFLRSAPRTSSGSMKPSGRGVSSVSSISSRRSFSASTRRTELCSKSVEMTWSPVRSAPLMARLSASVQLKAKATQKGSRAPSTAATASRAASTARAASSERRCPERPGLALKSVKAARMAVRTHSGFGWLVAALSR